MEQIQPGVLEGSAMRFYTVDEKAAGPFLYPLCSGRFVCDGRYRVHRKRYDSLLLLLVIRGEGYLETPANRQVLRRGALALVDCYEEHCYGTDSGWEILWCHFDGTSARSFETQVQAVYPENVRMLTGSDLSRAEEELDGIRREDSLPRLHLRLTRLLTFLLEMPRREETETGALDAVLSCIGQRFGEPITVAQMAEMAALSPWHFLRVFQKKMGMTPHAYLLQVRVNAARFYVSSGTLPLREIAWRCGFESASALCKAFRRVTGQTPGAYRQSAARHREDE